MGLDSIDLQDKQVTVKAGTAMEELSDILDDYSLALAVFPAIGWQTAAGAIMTATYGNGIKYEISIPGGLLGNASTHVMDK